MHLLDVIEKNFLAIDAWLQHKSSKYNAPVYVSADVRNNGFKVAPVDINLFPACFNNLSDQSRQQASINFKQFFQQQGINSICLIPENYTRNLMYLQNVHSIMQILQAAGLQCTVGHCSIDHDMTIEIGHGQQLCIKKMLEKAGYLQDLSGNKPDAILLNTDLISGPLVELSNVCQPIFPNADFGWHRRKKSSCFEVYRLLCIEFGTNFNIDPWFLCPLFDSCSGLDFRTMSNIDNLAEKVENILAQIAIKNREYSVPYSPAVFIKADNGSHGMGIILATSGEDVAKINKKNRDKMAKVKHNSIVDSVIIQETLETIEFYEGAPAEYLSLAVGGNFVSAMMRHNSLRTSSNNLNQKGAAFLDRSEVFSTSPVYTLISKLVALSAAIECSAA